MDTTKLSEMNLAISRQMIDAVILPTLSDIAEVETAMSKTVTGYIYEIRYKQPNTPFFADAHTINETYKSLTNFISLDKIREFMEGTAIHLGRLADKLDK